MTGAPDVDVTYDGDKEREARIDRLLAFIETLREERQLSVGGLSEGLFGDRSRLHNIINKRTDIGLSTLKVFYDQGLDVEWLLTGKKSRKGQ